MDGHGDTEEQDRRSDDPGPRLDPALPTQADDDCEDAADRGDPRRQRGTAFLQSRAEVPGEGQLQRDACAERSRKHQRAHHSGEDGCSTGERERNRDEPRQPPGLRNGDRVREVREHPGYELDAEHGERSAEYEGRPTLPRGERGERDEREPCNRDCAGARDHLRTKRVMMQRVDVQLTGVFRECTLELTPRRRV